MNYFLSSENRQAERAEFEARGLVFTNNLGYHMLIYHGGPEGKLGVMYRTLSRRTQELLESARTSQPELWQQAIEAYEATSNLRMRYFAELQAGAESHEATGAELETTHWRYHELASQLFNAMEPLTEEEALDLCR